MAEIVEVVGFCWACYDWRGKIYMVSSTTDREAFSRVANRLLLSEASYSHEQAQVLMNTSYVQNGQLVARPVMSLQVEQGVSGVLLVDGVPEATQVTIRAVSLSGLPSSYFHPMYQQFVADGTQLEISVEYPGEYSLELENFPYQAVQETVRIS